MKIILAQPRGFCAGVERAISIVETCLKKFSPPLYVHHEIVHNKFVVASLKAKGVIFVDNISQVPHEAVVIFSAHGVSQTVEQAAALRELIVIDATCPLVTKVHNEAKRHEESGNELIIIGHVNHPEVIGTSGRVQQQAHIVSSILDVEKLQINNPKVAYVTQTTLSVDDTAQIIEALKEKYPHITGPGLKDVCYATQNRQNAVKELAKLADIILVVGTKSSSNSNRLRDLAEQMGVCAYLIDSYEDLDLSWFEGKKNIGITAGASAPEELVLELVTHLSETFGASIASIEGIKENVVFKLPKELLQQ
jgi:4-hydroxy-3-methylbut-2-enyl diphosphate reductase